MGNAEVAARRVVPPPNDDKNRLRRRTDKQVLHAASEGDEVTLTRLVSGGANLHVRSKEAGEEDLGPLHLAAWGGHVKVLSILLEQNLNRESLAKGRCPVHWAAVGGHVEALKTLKAGGCDVHALAADGSSALHLAADFGNLEAVQWLVEEAGLHEDRSDGEGHSASYLARKAGHKHIHKYLNGKITERQILEAAADGELDHLEQLLEEGDDVTRQSTRHGEEGLCAVHLAAWGGHHLILQTLLIYGAEMEDEAKGRRPVHWAAVGGHVEALQTLKKVGCDMHALTADGSSALHLAADFGNLEAVRWLVEGAGLRVDLHDGEGHTASHLARSGKHKDIVRFLYSKNPLLQMKGCEVVSILGCGGFGEVYLVEKDKKKIVLKMTEQGLKEKGRASAEAELQLLKGLKHPHIVSFKGGTKSNKAVFLLTEYCAGGDMRQRIVRKKGEGKSFEESKILKWCCNVTEALKYLHEQGIIHRDVKPNNIFLTTADVAKLGDLGVAGVTSNFELPVTRAGTVGYMSPEVSNMEPHDARADVWSLGCCLYELAALRQGHPYTKVDVPGDYSDAYKDLVKSLLRTHAWERPTAATLLAHPLLQHVARHTDR